VSQGSVALVVVAALFGVLIGSVVNAPLWQQVGVGVLSAAIAFGTLRNGALLYGRLFAARNRPDNGDSERERSQ
jgi:hypothetical protein